LSNYAVHADAAEALVAEIASAGGRAIAVTADLADSAAAASATHRGMRAGAVPASVAVAT